MSVLPDCAICGGPVRLDPAGPVEECGWCGNRQRPIASKPDRAEIRQAVKARRRLLGPSCFGRRHHLCKASGCRCVCHDKTKGKAVNVETQITQVTVSALPEDNINHGSYAITVDYRGDGRWAVLHKGWCLSRDGQWEYEIRPSAREDGWLAAHRFTYDEALALAVKESPGIVVNGISAAEVAARAQA